MAKKKAAVAASKPEDVEIDFDKLKSNQTKEQKADQELSKIISSDCRSLKLWMDEIQKNPDVLLSLCRIWRSEKEDLYCRSMPQEELLCAASLGFNESLTEILTAWCDSVGKIDPTPLLELLMARVLLRGSYKKWPEWADKMMPANLVTINRILIWLEANKGVVKPKKNWQSRAIDYVMSFGGDRAAVAAISKRELAKAAGCAAGNITKDNCKAWEVVMGLRGSTQESSSIEKKYVSGRKSDRIQSQRKAQDFGQNDH